MARGRPPKPDAVKALAGNPGKRKRRPDKAPLADGEAAVQGADVAGLKVPPPPKHLTRAARDEWQRLAPDMVRLGLLRRLDQGAFEIYCELHATRRACQKVLAKEGPTYWANGVQRTRQEQRILSDCDRQIKAYQSEFGLTPAARARVAHVTGEGMGIQPALPGLDAPKPQTQPAAAPGAPAKTLEALTDDEFLRGPPN